jgi:hypothetical protein
VAQNCSIAYVAKNECFYKCILAEWSGEHESVRIDGDNLDTTRGRERHARCIAHLINVILETTDATPITLLQNWKPPAK